MNDTERKFVTENSIEMFDSLITAIDKAGGKIPTKQLLNMTVLDLICSLSVNGVRFTNIPIFKFPDEQKYYSTTVSDFVKKYGHSL